MTINLHNPQANNGHSFHSGMEYKVTDTSNFSPKKKKKKRRSTTIIYQENSVQCRKRGPRCWLVVSLYVEHKYVMWCTVRNNCFKMYIIMQQNLSAQCFLFQLLWLRMITCFSRHFCIKKKIVCCILSVCSKQRWINWYSIFFCFSFSMSIIGLQTATSVGSPAVRGG